MRVIIQAYARAFSGLSREVWLLSLIILVNRSGTMVLPFVALWITTVHHMPPSAAGQLLAFYGAGSVLGSWLGGRLTDRYGPRWVQAGSLLAGGAGFIALGMTERFGTMALTMVLLSVASEAYRPANGAAIAAATPPALRARAMALARLAVNVGMSIGPVIGGLMAEQSYDLLFVVDAATCAAAGILVVFFVADDKPAKGRPADVAPAGGGPWRDRTFLVAMAMSLLTGVVFMQFASTLPMYLEQAYGLSEAWIGLLMAINTVLIVGFEMVIVQRLERRDPLRLMAIGAAVTAVGFGLMPHGSTLAFASFTVVVWTIGEILSAPTSAAFAASRGDDRERGAYMGVYSGTYAVAFVIAPLVGTTLYGVDPDLVWHAVGAIGLLAAVGLWGLARRSDVSTQNLAKLT